MEQIEAVVAGLPDRYRALGVVAAGTGLRQGELFGLQVRDVDFLRRIVRVERQVQPTGVAPLKNRGAYRTIPIGKVVVTALAEHLRAYPAAGDEFIFRAVDSLPLHRGRFNTGPWRR